jgi:hypothetical protein
MEDFFKFSHRELDSCLPKEPLTKLDGSGKASILNYNLPQSTCFTVTTYIEINVPEDHFQDEVKAEPQVHFWQQIEALPEDQVVELLETSIRASVQEESVRLSEFSDLARRATARQAETIPNVEQNINNVPVNDIANQTKRGYRPYYTKNLYGKKVLRYSKKPDTAKPMIILVEHFRVCSYLGDYGAGKTLKTFSLLSGEKTEITLKTYKNSSETKSKAENILDSFTEDSANELENLISTESDDNNTFGQTVSNAVNASVNASVKGEVSIPIDFVKIGLSVQGGFDAGTNRTSTKNSTRSQNVKKLNSAMDKHVSKSSAVRELEVNTETTTTVETGEESTITWTLENINKSRVLNFVFRQLLQEYFTITYLEDVSLVFTNGYPESTFTAKLDGIEGFLMSLIPKEADMLKVRDEILSELSSIHDYQGNRVRFVEKVTQDIVDIEDNIIEQQSYYRKKADLQQTYREKTVPGIILDVQHRMLRTDSVIVDALLGQGEALDCFNLKLQEAANMKAYMENFTLYLQQLEKQQAMEVIDSIENPNEKADLYKRVFGDCCKELQTIVFHQDAIN